MNPSLNERYFKIIDSNEKAYWLGWILTDGCVTKENSLQLSLQKSDIKILQMLEVDLGLSNHIHIFNNDYIRFVVGSKAMCNDLVQYGVVPNKSHYLMFPQVNTKYEIALLRGLFEGDGGLTIGYTTRFYKHRNKSYTKPYQELSFTGTYSMCEGFQNTIRKYLNISIKKIKSNHSVYRVRWSNKQEIIQILDLIYDNCENYFLDRKYELYHKIKGGVMDG